MMAIAVKRQLGCSVKWIGARYHSLGIVFVPKDKRMKAIHDLLQLVKGELNCEQLRSLNGLLEFIAVVLMYKRNKMAWMYEPFQAWREASRGGLTRPKVSKLMRQSSWGWITGLSTSCAAPVSAALEHRQVLQFEHSAPFDASTVLHGMTSDASKEGAKVPGMGGYLGGLFWSIALDDLDFLWWFDIPALELMGFAVNLIVFGDILVQLAKGDKNLIIAFIDAQASPQLLIKTGTTSRVMSRVLTVIQELKIYKKLYTSLVVAHTAGEGNLASDDASRGEFELLHRYCSQVGTKARKVDVPQTAWDFLYDVWESVKEC